MDFFGIGGGELLLILVLALLIMEPGKLVGFAKNLGGLSRKAKKTSAELISGFKKELGVDKNPMDEKK
jgi:sec-independent protein translocase protein TatA